MSVLLTSSNFCKVERVKKMLPPVVFDFYDGLQDFCFVVAHTLRLPDMVHYVKTMVFPTVNKGRASPRDDACLDGLNILKKFPSVKEAKVVTKHDRSLDRSKSVGNTSKGKCDFPLQRTQISCITNCKKVSKSHLQCSATPNAMKQKGIKHKRSRSKNAPKTSTPLHECHMVQNCIIYSAECRELKNKVQQLEQEVILLKKQLTAVPVHHQAAYMVNNNHCSELHTVPTTQLMPQPPPPPPPPPPLLLSVQSSNIARVPTRKAKISKERGKENYSINMTEVLKGLTSVKLRPTDKSPGGTPVRKPPRRVPGQHSPASLLETALKKRFAGIYPDDSEDDDDDIPSP